MLAQTHTHTHTHINTPPIASLAYHLCPAVRQGYGKHCWYRNVMLAQTDTLPVALLAHHLSALWFCIVVLKGVIL